MSLAGLRRRPLRSLLTMLGVAIAVGAFIALVGVAQGLERGWTQGLANRGIHLLGMRKGLVEIMTSTIDQQLVERAAQVPGVMAAAGELFDLISRPGGVVGVSGWPEGAFLWQAMSFIKGGQPMGNPRGVVLGQRLAERLGLGLGDGLPLQGSRLEVAGIVRQANVFNDNVMVMPLETMQELLRKPGVVTVINLRLAQPGHPQAVRRVLDDLARALPELSFYETKDAGEANHIIQLLGQLNWTLSLIALVMAVFFITNTLLMSVSESTREIGILCALGWRRWRIMAKVAMEGLLLSAAGGGGGLVLGIWGLRHLAALPRLAGLIDPALTLVFLAQVLAATIALGCLGSFYPAWRATRLNPVEALRHE